MDRAVQEMLRDVPYVVEMAIEQIDSLNDRLGCSAPFYLKVPRNTRNRITRAKKATGESGQSLKKMFADNVRAELERRSYVGLSVRYRWRSLDFTLA